MSKLFAAATLLLLSNTAFAGLIIQQDIISDSNGVIGSITYDTSTGVDDGFGFVEMAQTDGVRAVAELNGQEVDGRALRVNEAQSKPRQGGRF